MKLLDVQELDSKLDLLRHRLRSLPETVRIDELTAKRTEVDNAARDARIAVADLTTEQRRADTDVEQVKARRVRDRDRMDQGLITNPKDLERMGHELESLERRITSLEDTELEVMERLEATQSELDARTAEVAELDTELEALTASRTKQAGEVEREAETVQRDRATAVSGLPENLVTLYEKLRAKNGGVGAAALRARQCGGCRLTQNPTDLSRFKAAPTDEVLRCEECDRILVRTSESGLGSD